MAAKMEMDVKALKTLDFGDDSKLYSLSGASLLIASITQKKKKKTTMDIKFQNSWDIKAMVINSTCNDTSSNNKKGVAQAEKQRSQTDMSKRVEGWKLRQNDHHSCYYRYELVQFHGSIWVKV